MSSDNCLLPLVALWRVLAPGFSPGFLASFVVLNRIRGFRDLNSENLYQQQPVFLSSLVFLQVTRCTTHCHFNRVEVEVLPTEQAAPVLTDIFRGVMTLHSRLQGQASNDCWTDFLECHHHHLPIHTQTLSGDACRSFLPHVLSQHQQSAHATPRSRAVLSTP